MVQGYLAKSGWGFPKGKVNEDEAFHDCAVREVCSFLSFQNMNVSLVYFELMSVLKTTVNAVWILCRFWRRQALTSEIVSAKKHTLNRKFQISWFDCTLYQEFLKTPSLTPRPEKK